MLFVEKLLKKKIIIRKDYKIRIDKKISSGLNLKVTVAEDPLNAVINGIGVLLNDVSTYSRVLVSTETEY